MHIKYLVKIMHSFNMAAIVVIFSIVITILSEIDLETLYIVYICGVVGHIVAISASNRSLKDQTNLGMKAHSFQCSSEPVYANSSKLC